VGAGGQLEAELVGAGGDDARAERAFGADPDGVNWGRRREATGLLPACERPGTPHERGDPGQPREV
jgi:hypothetical protein